MRLRSFFSLSFIFFLLLWGFTFVMGSKSGIEIPVSQIVAAAEKPQTELEKIDVQLEELEDMKRGFDARALRQENQAEYLQFDQQATLETRRHLQIAEENRQKSALVQKRIDDLKLRREKLAP